MKKKLPHLLVLLLFFLVFKTWFSQYLISAGDFSSYSFLSLKTINFLPYAWGWNLALDTLGSFVSPLSWLHFVETLPLLFSKIFNFEWQISERIFYLYPLLLFLFLVPSFVFNKLLPKINFSFFAVLIFSLNTYILMLIGGGQIFLSLAYALFPLGFYFFINSFSKKSLSVSLITGLIFSLEMMLDLRIAYIIIFGFLIYLIFNFSLKKEFFIKIVYSLIVTGFTAFLINSYWIIPVLLIHKNPFNDIGSIYITSGAVKFFSFARLENSISLLHPNWPENLFGKVYFMRAEFLIIPILAFSFLFFINKTKKKVKKILIFFGILGLIGSFLSKGVNDPFGSVYIFLFNHVPGFVMFRDPAKWYVLTALSYSILIPFSIYSIYNWIQSKKFWIKSKILNLENIFLILTILYLLFLIKAAILGETGGAFKATFVPGEYIKVEKLLSQDKTFYRTLWLPKVQRYSFSNDVHPIMSADNFFKEADYTKLIKTLKEDKTKDLLQNASVRFVIIPYDSQKEIFLKDRIYNDNLYQKTIDDLRKIRWLKEIDEFGKIKVFELENYKDHFWSESKELKIAYKYINPVTYQIDVRNAKKGDILIFSEGYNKYWQIKNGDFKINSLQFKGKFNSFSLTKDGNYTASLYYLPQDLVNLGLVISGLSFIVIIGFLVGLKGRIMIKLIRNLNS